MKYSVIESDSNPFSDYLKEDNPKYHEKIMRHYVKTVELVLGNNKSVLLTEFRKNKDRRAERVLYYVCGYDDYFYHFIYSTSIWMSWSLMSMDLPTTRSIRRVSRMKSSVCSISLTMCQKCVRL